MRAAVTVWMCMVLALGCSAQAPEAASVQEAPTADATGAPGAAPSEGAASPAAARGEPSLARLVGRVTYPSEYLPPMRVCALAKDDPGTAHCASTAENDPHFGISVPAGEWLLLAWPQDTGTAGDPGLLSQASECLGSGGTGCDDHALLPVRVGPGEHRSGLDINDWYYDPARFPPPMPPRDDAP